MCIRDRLEDIASALAAEYWDDYKKQFLDIVANSFLEELSLIHISAICVVWIFSRNPD